MQKISSIIPSSARVATVDLKDSGAVRPGAPSYGRPIGTSSLSEGRYLSTANIGVEAMTPRQRRNHEKAQIVDTVSSGFFMHKPLPKPPNAYNQEMQLINSDTQPQYYSKMAEGINYANPENNIMETENSFQDDSSASGHLSSESLSSEPQNPEYAYTGEHLDVAV